MYIPVHAIAEKLQIGTQILQLLSSFYALTGSDLTSYIARQTKKTCWDVLVQHNHLLSVLGVGTVLRDRAIQDADVFSAKRLVH